MRLYEKLTKYTKADNYPLHMPGHKRRGFDFVNPYTVDITEIDGFDDLHNPKGIIGEAQERLANLYGADKSFFLVNGSTSGVLAAISACTKQGDSILMARNCHKSVYNGAYLNKLNVDYIFPQALKSLSGSISPTEVGQKMDGNPRIKTVIISSPTYEGVLSDIEEIAKEVHKRGGVLIVDEAHGAHLKFGTSFPRGAIELGADLVIQSPHKTLPAFTQSAWIHVKGEKVNVSRLRTFLTMFQSSSPSYILMAGLDKCISFLENEGNGEFAKFEKLLEETRAELRDLENFELFGEKEDVFAYDPSKLVIVSKGEMSGISMARVLREKYRIEVEMAGPDYIIAMTSVMDTKKGLARFIKALKEMDKSAEIKVEEMADEKNYALPVPKVSMSIQAAFDGDTRFVDLCEARNQIAAEFVICYPPGIPLLAPGERVTAEVLEKITEFKALGVNLTGAEDLENDRLKVVI